MSKNKTVPQSLPEISIQNLLNEKYNQLCAQKANLQYQVEKLKAQIESIDEQVEALNASAPIVAQFEAQFKAVERQKREFFEKSTRESVEAEIKQKYKDLTQY